MTGIDPVPNLRALADGLGKCGIPVQIRQDGERPPYARASHPRIPLGTDVHYVRQDDGVYYFTSEWGTVIGPADDLATVIGYVVKLLRISFE
jgi:hypothetical protein